MPRIIEHMLTEQFRDKPSFSWVELFDFFRKFEPELKEGTLRWRIYELTKRNIIMPVRRGVYTILQEPNYKPTASPELLKLNKMILDQYPDVKYCIWDTAWLNEFSQHQSSMQMLIVEIEKAFVESLYYHLKDTSPLDVYLNPDEKVIEFYVAESKQPVVINRMVTRSPTFKTRQHRAKLTTPALEKILVDLYADSKLFYPFQGSELGHIYENAISKYRINYTKLCQAQAKGTGD